MWIKTQRVPVCVLSSVVRVGVCWLFRPFISVFFFCGYRRAFNDSSVCPSSDLFTAKAVHSARVSSVHSSRGSAPIAKLVNTYLLRLNLQWIISFWCSYLFQFIGPEIRFFSQVWLCTIYSYISLWTKHYIYICSERAPITLAHEQRTTQNFWKDI